VHRQTAGPSEEGSLAEERNRLMEAMLNGLAAREREAPTRLYLGEQLQNRICASELWHWRSTPPLLTRNQVLPQEFHIQI
jgi:hypothetical protein